MLVGLYFGSFNPIHNGHISIAKQMLKKVGFDEVWMVVSPQNPLKESIDLASNYHRLRMVELALEPLNLPIKACDVEFSLPTPSYTIDTLKVLVAQYPSVKFALIMGSDNVAVIEKWKDYQQLLSSVPVYFYPRIGDSSDLLATKYGLNLVEASFLQISSTQIRDLLSSHQSIEGLVPIAVADYIAANCLYA